MLDLYLYTQICYESYKKKLILRQSDIFSVSPYHATALFTRLRGLQGLNQEIIGGVVEILCPSQTKYYTIEFFLVKITEYFLTQKDPVKAI